jgi:hypothetical protein
MTNARPKDGHTTQKLMMTGDSKEWEKKRSEGRYTKQDETCKHTQKGTRICHMT